MHMTNRAMNIQTNTLTRRITQNLMFWVSLVWAISAIGVAAYVKYEIDEAFDQALLDKAMQLDAASQLAASLAHRVDAFWETMRWLFLPMLAFLPVLAVIVWRIVWRELEPVAQLTHQLAQRGGQNLTALTAESGFPSELTVIVDSTNRLLERMTIALDTERSLAANAAHELRTPIATARLRIANALHYQLPSAVQVELKAAVTGLDRLTRRTEKLLQLSRAEGSQSLSTERVAMAELVRLVVQEFSVAKETPSRLHMHFPSDSESLWIVGDMDTLAVALRNLIENALRHAPTAQVLVALAALGSGRIGITVTDDGAGVSDVNLALLAQRHVRQSKNQTGYGLGLSIVKTIVLRHKGTLSFASPPTGLTRGFEARIELPYIKPYN
jgi:two-component system, OmpR family, sensor kinase